MNKIEIKVQPAYIAEQSDPGNNHYVFSYTVTIRNNGSKPAKLLTRHWYTSGTFMNTPFGTMQGSYQMISDSGEKFDAEIPTFQLSVPNTLH